MTSDDRFPALTISSPSLNNADALVHGFSTRCGGVSTCYRAAGSNRSGDLNLGFTAHDDPDHVRRNRSLFLQSIDATGFPRFSLLNQRHTPIVNVLASPEDAADDFLQPAVPVGDGAMTNVPGILLTVQTADCVPVLLLDPKRRAVAAIHAGWRGTVERIVEDAVSGMGRHYGSDPADIVAVIGPSIGPASYTVGEEVRQRFASHFRYAEALFSEEPDGGPLRLDLWEANRRQLLDAGLPAEHIDVTGHDTATATDRFFSHRAEAGFTGRMMSAIGLAD